MIEHCSECDIETDHAVHIERRAEGGTEETAQYAVEPYRVTVCEECEHETATRMNAQ